MPCEPTCPALVPVTYDADVFDVLPTRTVMVTWISCLVLALRVPVLHTLTVALLPAVSTPAELWLSPF